MVFSDEELRMLRLEAWRLTRRLVKMIRYYGMEKMIGDVGFSVSGKTVVCVKGFGIWLPLLCRIWLRRVVRKIRIEQAQTQLNEFEKRADQCDCNKDTSTSSDCQGYESPVPTDNPWLKQKEITKPTLPPNRDTCEGLVSKQKETQ